MHSGVIFANRYLTKLYKIEFISPTKTPEMNFPNSFEAHFQKSVTYTVRFLNHARVCVLGIGVRPTPLESFDFAGGDAWRTRVVQRLRFHGTYVQSQELPG